jgi:hypothetical protein
MTGFQGLKPNRGWRIANSRKDSRRSVVDGGTRGVFSLAANRHRGLQRKRYGRFHRQNPMPFSRAAPFMMKDSLSQF